MQNYFHKLPKDLRSKDSKLIPLLAIGIALIGIVSIVSIISESTDIRKFAATINLGRIPSGCYYMRGQCTGSQTPGATGSCKPILVCPTNTPAITPTEAVTPTLIPAPTEIVSPTKPVCSPRPACLDSNPPCQLPEPIAGWCPALRLDCASCLSEGASSLCLDLNSKSSSCSNRLESISDQNRVCVPCKPLPPNPNPYKCVFLPACPDTTLPCADQQPVEGWCFIGSTTDTTTGTSNVLFQQ